MHVPEEIESQHPHTSASVPIKQQIHYKIIFIKAPTTRAISRTQLTQLAQPQTSEKTLVYVLTKKEDSLAELTQNIQQTQVPYVPNKPEVYFIKYKTQKAQGQHVAQNNEDDRFPIPIAPSNPFDTESIVTTAAINQNINDSGSIKTSNTSNASSSHKPAAVYGSVH